MTKIYSTELKESPSKAKRSFQIKLLQLIFNSLLTFISEKGQWI